MVVGTHHTATLLIVDGDNPERLESEAFFASLFESSPVQASSGKDVRRRLNRGGNFEVAVRRTATPWSALWSMSTV